MVTEFCLIIFVKMLWSFYFFILEFNSMYKKKSNWNIPTCNPLSKISHFFKVFVITYLLQSPAASPVYHTTSWRRYRVTSYIRYCYIVGLSLGNHFLLLASFTLSGSAFQWFTTLVLKKFFLISVFAEAGTRLNLELDCLVDLDAVSAALVNQLPSSYTWPCVSGTL